MRNRQLVAIATQQIYKPIFSIITRGVLLAGTGLFLVGCLSQSPTGTPSPPEHKIELQADVDAAATLMITILPGGDDKDVVGVQRETSEDIECPGLEYILLQFSKTPYPAAFADENHLFFEDPNVGVEIQLANQSVTLSKYHIILRNQRGLIMEAYVLQDQLCNLANDEFVISVKAMKQTINP